LLCVGTELSETDFWSLPPDLGPDVIRIDIDSASLSRPYPADIAILGDAKLALDAIAAKLTARSGPAIDTGALHQRSHDPVLVAILDVVRKALPEETVICSDMTQIAYVANEAFPVQTPRTWFHPVGFGTLGFALPAVIGAKFGVGKTPVAAMIGDYGIQYTINELGTAAEHKLPLVVLLWNNNLLGAIHDSMARAGIQPNAVTLKNPDFQALAKAYGCQAAKPSSLSALAAAIAAALKADGPTLIEMTPAMARAP
jgi:thiamine pyrophosphate-dependent acetolactate synthase large subunit-like protein